VQQLGRPWWQSCWDCKAPENIDLVLVGDVYTRLYAATRWAITSPNCRSFSRQVLGSSRKNRSASVPSWQAAAHVF